MFKVYFYIFLILSTIFSAFLFFYNKIVIAIFLIGIIIILFLFENKIFNFFKNENDLQKIKQETENIQYNTLSGVEIDSSVDNSNEVKNAE